MEILDRIELSDVRRERTIEEVLRDGYRFEFGVAFNRIFKYFVDTWALCLAHVAITGVTYYLGAIIIFISILGAMNFASFAEQETPDVNMIMSKLMLVYGIIACFALLIVWPMRAGHWIHFHRRYVGGSGSFGDFFAVFGRKYIKVVALSFMIFLISAIWVMVPGWFYMQSMFLAMESMAAGGRMMMPDFSMMGWMMLGYIPTIFFTVSLSLAVPLILFQTDDVLEAISASIRIMWKKWFVFFALFLVMYIFALAGFIGLCIGILVTNYFLPWATFSIYEQIFVTGTMEKTDL